MKNTIFSGFLPLNYVIYIFDVCFLCFLLCGGTEEACSMVNSLRKVDFSHPTGHYTWEKIRPPPLENILGAPLGLGIIMLSWLKTKRYTSRYLMLSSNFISYHFISYIPLCSGLRMILRDGIHILYQQSED